MKTLIVLTLFLFFLSIDLISQPKKYFIEPHLITQPTKFNVVHTGQLSSQQTATINSFTLKPGELKAVVKVESPPTKVDIPPSMIKEFSPNTKLLALPEVYFAKESGTNNTLSYQIFYVAKSPMKLDFMQRTFKGFIRFIAIEPNLLNDPTPMGKQLASPEEILVTFEEARIPVSINQINFPPYDVPILYQEPLDSLEVKIFTPGNPQGYSAALPVIPAIILTCNRTTIQGLGLQTIPINVSLKGVTSYKPISISVISSLGTIDSSSLTLRNNIPKIVILRSEGLGKIDVNVVSPNYPGNTITVNAVFPWLFLILSLAGGFLGGIGRKLKGKGKITLRLITYSCIIGLLVAVVYWGLGIKLIHFSFEDRGYNESMVFALGLIAGYFGISDKSKSGDTKT
jgi:hypothetical protein